MPVRINFKLKWYVYQKSLAAMQKVCYTNGYAFMYVCMHVCNIYFCDKRTSNDNTGLNGLKHALAHITYKTDHDQTYS